VIRESFANYGISKFRQLLFEILIFTFATELVGAVILLFAFGDGGIFNALFHSIAAFCNAGFSLHPNNMMNYGGIFIVNIVLCFLIITGGIGFLVARDIRLYILGSVPRPTLHSKIVLSMTVIFLLGGALLILGIEWDNAL
jgi:trk system potassium uptake protein TrkH